MIVQTSYLDGLIAALLTYHGSTPPAPPLDGVKIGLCVGPFTPDRHSLMSNLTEADYTGYAQSSALVWGTPLNEVDGSVSVVANLVPFRVGSTPTVTNVIAGWFMTDGATPPKLLAMEKFNDPIAMSHAADGFDLAVKWNYGSDDTNSTGVVIQ